MAYTLNSVDFSTFNIIPGQHPGGNVALIGCFDFPERIGDTYHSWDDENGIEPYLAADELFFGGRDLRFKGHISGTKTQIYANLSSLYSLVNSQASGTVVFSTPYGNFNVYVQELQPTHYNGICVVDMLFREPVVTLTGGSIPSAGGSTYQINGVPMSSYGLYYNNGKDLYELPAMKDQYFTKIEAEGFQIVKRTPNLFNFSGYVIADTFANFQTHIRNLFALYASEGLKIFNLNNQLSITCFPAEGFKISNLYYQNYLVASFKSTLIVTSMT